MFLWPLHICAWEKYNSCTHVYIAYTHTHSRSVLGKEIVLHLSVDVKKMFLMLL